MHLFNWIQLLFFLAVVFILIKPVGLHLCRVLTPGEKTFLDPVFKPVEKFLYRICRIDPMAEQGWKEYLACVLVFSAISVAFCFGIVALQSYFPFNPQKFDAPSWDLNLNTAISFMTNTNWQNYGGESTLSYFSQMAALAVQNFVSPAVGLAVAATLVRGLERKSIKVIGNFWSDLVRICLYILLPISILAATIFLSEGVPQNFEPYVQAETLEGTRQTIAQGPIASQEAIKILGSNGGGFMNVNSSHPYENPSPVSNFLQFILILLLPAAQIYYFGRSIGDPKHAWCIIVALTIVFLVGFFVCEMSERGGNPEWAKWGIYGGNWEGKEQRFGLFGSTLFACATTVVACGAVNSMHDSFTPLGGMIPMLNMQLSEVIFGGVGAGLYSVLLFIFLCIFISGLIIGRTPEYLGNRIESREIKMTVFAMLAFVLIVHCFTSLACFSDWGLNGLGNESAHGFSEILYAFSSCTANNGSSFAGLSGNNLPYNLALGFAMLLGRFCILIPVLALAGSFGQKKIHPKSAGTFPVSSLVFISLLVGVILLVGALTFLPALTMGPIIEQFFMLKGMLFP